MAQAILGEPDLIEVRAERLRVFSKIYDHLKTHLKKAVIRFDVDHRSNGLCFLVGFGRSGLLKFHIPDCLNPLRITNKESSYAIRNVSFGNTFVHSQELFGSNVADISFRFYAGQESGQRFVSSEVGYVDGVTSTRHKSVLDDLNGLVSPPTKSLGLLSKILLSNRTATSLQKWARGLKSKEAGQNAVITINQTLSVMVFSVEGACSKTIDFLTVEGEPDEVLTQVEKQVDVGCLKSDSTFTANLEAIIAALGCCKIPGVAGVALKTYDCQILELEAVPTKQHADKAGSVQVLLIDGGESSVTPGQNFDVVDDHPGDREEDLFAPDTLAPPEPQERSLKRKSKAPSGPIRSKKSKSVFNPII